MTEIDFNRWRVGNATITKCIPLFRGATPDTYVARCECRWEFQSFDLDRTSRVAGSHACKMDP